MKIVFICYDGINQPSSRVRCYDFSKYLNRLGHNTEVFSFKDHLNAPYDGGESYKTPNIIRLSLLFKAFFRLLKYDKNTIFYVQKAGFHSLGPLLVHKIQGNKLVLDYDDYEFESKGLSNWIFKKITKNASICIAASNSLKDFLSKYHKHVFYIPTGVDLNKFQNKNKLRNHKKLRFVWTGFLNKKEIKDDLLFFLQCFDEVSKKYDRLQLDLIGGGPYMGDIISWLKDNEVKNILYLGKMDSSEIPGQLLHYDVGIFPLIHDDIYNRSKSPTKLFEYMASDIVPFTTNIGEFKFILKDEENGIVSSSDKTCIIKKMVWIINNRNKLDSISLNARKTVEAKYNLGVLSKDLEKILMKIK